MTDLPRPTERLQMPFDHRLQIFDENLGLIKNGQKTLEVRLEDPSTQNIQVGQTLLLESGKREIWVKIVAIRKYKTIEELMQMKI